MANSSGDCTVQKVIAVIATNTPRNSGYDPASDNSPSVHTSGRPSPLFSAYEAAPTLGGITINERSCETARERCNEARPLEVSMASRAACRAVPDAIPRARKGDSKTRASDAALALQVLAVTGKRAYPEVGGVWV